MSKTPRTDEFLRAECYDLDHLASFTRQLEREIQATTRDFRCLAELLDGHDAAECRSNLIRMKQLLANNMRRKHETIHQPIDHTKQ